MWSVYARPADYPLGFVARRFEIHPGYAVATLDARYGPDLEAVRAQLPPGLVCIPREPDDDPCIVETWL